jgi:hypothetical protein
MNNAEAINEALVAANAARLAGFEYTQKALLDIVKKLQQSHPMQADVTLEDS